MRFTELTRARARRSRDFDMVVGIDDGAAPIVVLHSGRRETFR
jgi:hypothetical protein